MDPATDLYYRWLTIIAVPVMYNLMMLITRSVMGTPLLGMARGWSGGQSMSVLGSFQSCLSDSSLLSNGDGLG